MKFKIDESDLFYYAYAEIDGFWCRITTALERDDAVQYCKDFAEIFNRMNNAVIHNTTYLEI